jgi:ubiquinone biosynthesis protein COQ9
MSETDPYLETRAHVLEKALPHVAFDGWSQAVLERAIAEAEIDENMAVLAFPRGVDDLIAAFSAAGDAAMMQALPQAEGLKIRERITEAVWLRLMVNKENIEASRRAAAYLSVPGRQKLAADLCFKTAHLMWRWAGDTATDYNYYSKRLILSGVITATRLYWFDDQSEDFADTRAFLERRIDNVMQFEKVKAKARGWSEKLHGDKAPFDALIGALAKMRYRQS